MTRRGEACLAPTCRHQGASSGEGAFSTARYRTELPSLQTEEFRMNIFRQVDRKTAYLLPPSLEDWLPEDHLARFIVEVVDGLDPRRLEKAYAR
jgi:hypothetical protein